MGHTCFCIHGLAYAFVFDSNSLCHVLKLMLLVCMVSLFHVYVLGGVEVDIGDPIGMHFGGGDEPIPSSLHMFTEDI